MIEEYHRRFSLEWLITLSSSFGRGVVVAFVFSIAFANPAVQFALSWKAWASFLIIAWLSFWGCRAFFSTNLLTNSGAGQPSRRRWFYGLTVLGLGGTFAAMAYSLRGISQEKLSDVGFAGFFVIGRHASLFADDSFLTCGRGAECAFTG
ncbi:MAG: hypothetical protein M2R45_01492 [Verrucomicrobia subdivision 3 bacterium]|nr:hypothetical protein [Limisphaerales bacterium]MCS1413378.1 hypothetical protein [Limisphaerales bacterium]